MNRYTLNEIVVTSPINQLTSSLASLDVLSFQGGYKKPQSLNKRIGLWTHNLKFEEQEFNLNPDCKVCGTV